MLLERLRASMESQPLAYVVAMEELVAQILAKATPGPSTMEKYVRDEHIGHEKILDYMTWVITRALTAMRAGANDKARLILMLGLASVEQYKLDSSWPATWKLTQLLHPPFAEWKAKDAVLTQLRTDHAHARIIHPTWATAVIARLKDEEVLVKRRQTEGRRPRTRLRGLGSEVRPDMRQDAKALRAWVQVPHSIFRLFACL